MQQYRPDRVVRFLTLIVSVMFWGACAVGVVLLILVPALEAFADSDARDDFMLGVPVTADLDAFELSSSWAGGRGAIKLGDAQTVARVPLSVAPAWFRMTLYAGGVLGYSLLLLFLYHLRQLFLRVRNGVPFDTQNALRLRWLGLLLLAMEVSSKVFAALMSATVLRTVSAYPFPLGTSYGFDGAIIFLALVLIALAEIFRRGAVLEDEQALVV